MLNAIRQADADYFGKRGSVFSGVTAVIFGAMPWSFMRSRIGGYAERYDMQNRLMVQKWLNEGQN